MIELENKYMYGRKYIVFSSKEIEYAIREKFIQNVENNSYAFIKTENKTPHSYIQEVKNNYKLHSIYNLIRN